MRILICDDDPIILELLEKYIKIYFSTIGRKCPDIALFNNGESLLDDQGDKDILFLDIEMPGMNGIYVGNELKKQNNNIIIFVATSYSEYLDDAMRFHVFRYISKPIDRQRLFRNMNDALVLYHSISSTIPIETRQGVTMVKASSIIMIEAQHRKVIVHTVQGKYESVHNMDYWLNHLPRNQFFQTHRSFIINLSHVTDFDHSLVHMAGNFCDAYLTKRKYSSFKETYLLYLESTR